MLTSTTEGTKPSTVLAAALHCMPCRQTVFNSALHCTHFSKYIILNCVDFIRCHTYCRPATLARVRSTSTEVLHKAGIAMGTQGASATSPSSACVCIKCHTAITAIHCFVNKENQYKTRDWTALRSRSASKISHVKVPHLGTGSLELQRRLCFKPIRTARLTPASPPCLPWYCCPHSRSALAPRLRVRLITSILLVHCLWRHG